MKSFIKKLLKGSIRERVRELENKISAVLGLESRTEETERRIKVLEDKIMEMERKTISKKTLKEDAPVTVEQVFREWQGED